MHDTDSYKALLREDSKGGKVKARTPSEAESNEINNLSKQNQEPINRNEGTKKLPEYKQLLTSASTSLKATHQGRQTLQADQQSSEEIRLLIKRPKQAIILPRNFQKQFPSDLPKKLLSLKLGIQATTHTRSVAQLSRNSVSKAPLGNFPNHASVRSTTHPTANHKNVTSNTSCTESSRSG